MSERQARRFVWLQQHPVPFHIGAWLNASVPILRGRLSWVTGTGSGRR
jgi:hypothetical protein